MPRRSRKQSRRSKRPKKNSHRRSNRKSVRSRKTRKSNQSFRKIRRNRYYTSRTYTGSVSPTPSRFAQLKDKVADKVSNRVGNLIDENADKIMDQVQLGVMKGIDKGMSMASKVNFAPSGYKSRNFSVTVRWYRDRNGRWRESERYDKDNTEEKNRIIRENLNRMYNNNSSSSGSLRSYDSDDNDDSGDSDDSSVEILEHRRHGVVQSLSSDESEEQFPASGLVRRNAIAGPLWNSPPPIRRQSAEPSEYDFPVSRRLDFDDSDSEAETILSPSPPRRRSSVRRIRPIRSRRRR